MTEAVAAARKLSSALELKFEGKRHAAECRTRWKVSGQMIKYEGFSYVSQCKMV
jgi:hypothetical protein